MFIQRKTDLKLYIAWKQASSAEHVCFRGDVSFYICFSLYKYILAYLYSFIYISIYILIYNYVKLCLYKE